MLAGCRGGTWWHVCRDRHAIMLSFRSRSTALLLRNFVIWIPLTMALCTELVERTLDADVVLLAGTGLIAPTDSWLLIASLVEGSVLAPLCSLATVGCSGDKGKQALVGVSPKGLAEPKAQTLQPSAQCNETGVKYNESGQKTGDGNETSGVVDYFAVGYTSCSSLY